MIIMALDHVRDFFHGDAFVYSPTDLGRTSVFLFFTRLITHYCAPVFVFLAGVAAHLYGARRTRKELSVFLLTRGIWLVLLEFTVIALERSFNPHFTFITLQVIWAIGISMIVLSALVWMDRRVILFTGLLLIAGHNLLDKVHVPGTGMASFLWALLHDHGFFTFGPVTFHVFYPLLPWIGIMAVGFCFGSLYLPGYDPARRRKMLFAIGSGAILLFILLRSGNFYGDAAYWSVQKNPIFSFLSFLNVTKYPPSLLYILMTLGPALIFLALSERPLNAWTARIAIYGRVPMFYYLAHVFLIHFLALIAAQLSGYRWTDMILNGMVNSSPDLKGYGFNLPTVYIIWIGLVLTLYPFCKWYDRYKRSHQATKWWLSYL